MLAQKGRDLNTSKQFIRSVGISAVFHAVFVLCIVIFAQFNYKPNVIVPGYTVNLVSAKKPPSSLLDPSQLEKKPRIIKKKKLVKEKSYRKMKKKAKKVQKMVKKTSKIRKVIPKKKKLRKPAKEKIVKIVKKTVSKTVPKEASAKTRKSITTEGDPFTHVWYIKIVERKVNGNWVTHGLNVAGQRSNPLVYFSISRDGQALSLKLLKSSGVEELDNSALIAVSEAQPFPPLPDDFKPKTLNIRYEFFYEQTFE
ncbi:MAG TPA: energy transducer TonB [Nitrospinota bacterium]|nr:energy transducer TonB [Nitrospinota bacterium]